MTTPAVPRDAPLLASTTATWRRSWSRWCSSWARSTFGFLESWSRTFLAIGTSIVVELVLGRLLGGKWPHLASSYISGISVGMLIRSPEFWPYALCAAISITSKYVLRMDGRHLWNPSNFGIVAMLVLASNVVASLSVQWGNTLLPMVVVWLFGSVIIHRLGRFHITLTYVASFLAFSLVRAAVTGPPVAGRGGADHRADVPALHLLHDHGPEDDRAHEARADASWSSWWRRWRRPCGCMEFVHAPYYALFVVGPIANFVEILQARRAKRLAGMEAA